MRSSRVGGGGEARAVANMVPTALQGKDNSVLTISSPRPREQPVMRYEDILNWYEMFG